MKYYMKKLLFFLTLTTVQIAGLQAQEFEVVSLKQLPASHAFVRPTGSITVSGSNLYMRTISMGWIVRYAFNKRTYQINGPEWLNYDSGVRYDLIAKTTEKVSEPEIRKMLQKLLLDQTELKYHLETKIIDAYVLEGTGSKLEFIEPNVDVKPSTGFDHKTSRKTIKNMHMEYFIDDLSMSLNMPFVDLSTVGKKIFNGSFVLDVSSIDMSYQSVLTGLKNEMGFVVSKRKMPVEIMVVDHILQLPKQ